MVRKVAQLAKKEKSSAARGEARAFVNPFLPYDPLMYVADISATHVCLLNKFNVVDYHILACSKVCVCMYMWCLFGACVAGEKATGLSHPARCVRARYIRVFHVALRRK